MDKHFKYNRSSLNISILNEEMILIGTRVSIQEQENFLSMYCCSSRTLVLQIHGDNSTEGLDLYAEVRWL